MTDVNLYTIFIMYMFCQMLGAIDASVLTACATKGEHEISKAALQVALHMRICQFIDIFQKGKNLSVVLQKTDNRFIQTCKLFVWFITTRIMRATAVKNVSAAISAGVFGNTFLE